MMPNAFIKVDGLPTGGNGDSHAINVKTYRQLFLLAPGADGTRYRVMIKVATAENPASGDYVSFASSSGFAVTSGDAYYVSFPFPVAWVKVTITDYTTGNPSADGITIALVA